MAKSSFLQRRYLVPQKLLPLGPFKGVRDIGDSGQQDPAFLQDAINVVFEDSQNGGAVSARTRFVRLNSSQLESTASTEEFLCIHGHEAASGTIYVFAVQSGKVWRQSGATSWTDVTPTGITIQSNVRVHAVSYNDEIIFSDGTNRPWRATDLGASPITGTYIQVNSSSQAWAARGAPTVYGGKLFFIASAINSVNYQSRLVWSEELDAATGYMQTGYTNFWDVVPTSSEKMTGIIGTNTALFYFRRYSIGAVYGAVNADFTTATTHDAVTQEIGTAANFPLLLAKGYIWFLDAEGHPCRFRVGSSTIEPVWQQLRNRVTKIKATALDSNGYLLDYPSMAYSHDINKVAILFLRDSSATGDASKNLYIFDADTGSYEGRWQIEQTSQDTGEPPSAAAYLDTIASVPVATAASGYTGTTTFVVGGSVSGLFGFLRRQSSHKEQDFGDNSAAMHMSITTMLAPNDQVNEFRVDEIAVDALPDDATLSLDYYTPRGSSTGLSLTGITGSDSIQSSHDHGRYVAGLNALGRWFRAVLHWNVASGSTRRAFERAMLKVRGFTASPRAK